MGLVDHPFHDSAVVEYIEVRISSALFSEPGPVGLEFHGSIEPGMSGIHVFAGEALHLAEVEVWESRLPDLFSPHSRGIFRVGQVARTVDHEKRSALHLDITGIPECPDEPRDMLTIILLALLLPHEDFLVPAIPDPGPVLVGPAQAEGKIRSSRLENIIEDTV